MIMGQRHIVWLTLAALAVVGCSEATAPAPEAPSLVSARQDGAAVATVDITPASATVLLNLTQQFTAVARDRRGRIVTGVALSWSSSQASLAPVSPGGLVTGRAVGGPVTISASTGGKKPVSGSAVVTVLLGSTPMASTTFNHSCAVVRSGHLYCWGDNQDGRLGTGAVSAYEPTPTRVGGTARYRAVAAGNFHTCALTTEGDAWCWGNNSWGQVGNGTVGGSPILTPQAVGGDHKFTAIVSAAWHSCGLEADGTVFCWGGNREGQLGIGRTSEYETSPQQVTGSLRFTKLEANSEYTCALAEDRRAFCWGKNMYGELGYTNGRGTWVSSPQLVLGGQLYTDIAADSHHTCGVTTTGSVMCWGSNFAGELGIGLPPSGGDDYRPLPVAVLGLANAADVATGGYHTCAVQTDGQAVCWGRNREGQLGIGSFATGDAPWAVPTPTTLEGGLLLISVTAGMQHTCSVTAQNALYCWGDNSMGQVGDGSTTNKAAPVLVMQLEQ